MKFDTVEQDTQEEEPNCFYSIAFPKVWHFQNKITERVFGGEVCLLLTTQGWKT